jgi:3-hydroxyanthranilate 3,4-dioxygenase
MYRGGPFVRVPINLHKWIAENRHDLKPPVANRLIWEDGEFMVFVVAGPNGRTDLHMNQGEEFFYQIEGDIFLKTWQDDQFKDIFIREGEIFLLPKGLPHSPQRPANTVGIVIESKRASTEKDGLMWRCPVCTEKMYEEYFHLTNIVTQFKPVFDRFFSSDLSTCKKCGHRLTKESSFLPNAPKD